MAQGVKEALGLDEDCLAAVASVLMCNKSSAQPCACTSVCVLATMFSCDTDGAIVTMNLTACLLKHSILPYLCNTS